MKESKVAVPRKEKKPATSVTVVRMIDDAVAPGVLMLVFVPAAIVGTIAVPITVVSRVNRRELPAESMASRVTFGSRP